MWKEIHLNHKESWFWKIGNERVQGEIWSHGKIHLSPEGVHEICFWKRIQTLWIEKQCIHQTHLRNRTSLRNDPLVPSALPGFKRWDISVWNDKDSKQQLGWWFEYFISFLFFIENQGLFLLKKKKRKENVLLVWKYSLKFHDDKGGV